jgi:hypothetical protein
VIADRRSEGVPEEQRPNGPDGRPVERRASQPFLLTSDELLGRRPIRLRRARDKRRLAAHLAIAAALVALSGWWVVPLHSFAGPVLLVLTSSHGVHAGDLPVLAFLAVAGRSLMGASRLIREG